MAKSKIVYGGETLIDLTGDTVTPAFLPEGVTAHDAAGNPITGEMTAHTLVLTYEDDTVETVTFYGGDSL